MTTFLTTVLIILLVYFGLKYIIKWLSPFIMRYIAKKAAQKFGQAFGHDGFNSQPVQKEGNVSIDKIPTKKPGSKSSVGEYVDFEEID